MPFDLSFAPFSINAKIIYEITIMKIEFERAERLQYVFKNGAKQATKNNTLIIWEDTILKIIELERKDLLVSWERLNSFEKQVLTNDYWFSFRKFLTLLPKEKID